MKKLFALLLALVLATVSCACFAEETPAASGKEAIEFADPEFSFDSIKG